MSLLVPSDGALKTVVFIVCGGFKVSLGEIEEYRDIVRKELAITCEGTYNGEQWSIKKMENTNY
jgi:L-serine/L-threonine ammonia-lyase